MSCKRLLAALLAAFMFAPALPALAQRRRAAKAPAKASSASTAKAGGRVLPPINYTQFFLPNGLRIVLHEDHSTPIVATNVWYHVGSKNESPGRTGFAHLFEHMMFQGSKNYDNDYFKPLQEAGAVLNGSTNNDRTNYWEVLPSNFLELAIFMEADRMGGLLDAMTQEKLDTYFNSYIERVQAVTVDDINRVARRYLNPDHVAIVIVGDRQRIEPSLRSLKNLGDHISFVDAEGKPAERGGAGGGGERQ